MSYTNHDAVEDKFPKNRMRCNERHDSFMFSCMFSNMKAKEKTNPIKRQKASKQKKKKTIRKKSRLENMLFCN